MQGKIEECWFINHGIIGPKYSSMGQGERGQQFWDKWIMWFFSKCILVKHSIHLSSQYECCDFRLSEDCLYCWIFFFEIVYWLLVKNLDLGLNMSGFYKYVFSLIRWNQLTRKVIANGFYKCIKIYCFFLKHFITLLNVPFSFLCHQWQSTVIIYSLMPSPENIDL